MVDSGPSKGEIALVNKPLNKLSTKNAEINLSAFALLFREMVNYCDSRVTTIEDQHAKLCEMGKHVGSRYLELVWFREKQYKRENRLIHLLTFVQKNLWRALFNKEIDNLEQQVDSENAIYYLIEKEPLVNRLVPVEGSGLNCAAFNAGIVQGKVSTWYLNDNLLQY
ncbi:trafficking protein particle complex subunit 5-like [Convolutriloba macropyga]|uniref:trafficking protein particle complex subunit 5-like n=1 Tax=Convolutriloba macropyga TaxID=536237 RepID=UPI003F51D4D4